MKITKRIIAFFLTCIMVVLSVSCDNKKSKYNGIWEIGQDWSIRVLSGDEDVISRWLATIDTSVIKYDARWDCTISFCDDMYNESYVGTRYFVDLKSSYGAPAGCDPFGDDMGNFVDKLRQAGGYSLLSQNGEKLSFDKEFPFVLSAPKKEMMNRNFINVWYSGEGYARATGAKYAIDTTGYVGAKYALEDGTQVLFKRYYDFSAVSVRLPETVETDYTVKRGDKTLEIKKSMLDVHSDGSDYFCTDGENIFSFYVYLSEGSDIKSVFKDLEITDIEIPKITEESTRLVYRFPEYDRGKRDYDDYAIDYTQEMKHLLSSDEQYVWLDEFKDERQELYNMGEGMDSLVEQIRENGFYFLAYDSEWYSSWKAEPAENEQYPENFPLTLISAAEGVDSLIDTKPGENEEGTFRNACSELEILAHSVQRLPIEYGCNLIFKAYYGCDNTDEIFSELEKQELDVTVAGEEIDWYFAGNFCYDGLCPRGISYLCEYNGVIFEFSAENTHSYVECGCEEGKPHDFWQYDLGSAKLDIVPMTFTE